MILADQLHRGDAVLLDGHPPALGLVVRVYPAQKRALVRFGEAKHLLPLSTLSLPLLDSDSESSCARMHEGSREGES